MPSKTAIQAVNTAFGPPHIGRVIRNVLASATVTALLVLAALTVAGWLSVALWAVVALRVVQLVLGAASVERYAAEKRRRVEVVPEPYRTLLLTGRVEETR